MVSRANKLNVSPEPYTILRVIRTPSTARPLTVLVLAEGGGVSSTFFRPLPSTRHSHFGSNVTLTTLPMICTFFLSSPWNSMGF